MAALQNVAVRLSKPLTAPAVFAEAQKPSSVANVASSPFRAVEKTSAIKKYERKRGLLRLSDALMELPDAQRDAVILRHLQGLSLAEAAHQLGRTEAAVAGLIYRGLNKLHDLLDERE